MYIKPSCPTWTRLLCTERVSITSQEKIILWPWLSLNSVLRFSYVQTPPRVGKTQKTLHRTPFTWYFRHFQSLHNVQEGYLWPAISRKRLERSSSKSVVLLTDARSTKLPRMKPIGQTVSKRQTIENAKNDVFDEFRDLDIFATFCAMCRKAMFGPWLFGNRND